MKNERKARILVVDDEENIRKSLKMILEYEGYAFLEAANGRGRPGDRSARRSASTSSSSTSRCRAGAASRSWRSIKARPVSPEVIMISGQGTIQAAVEATKLGAFDFLEKPLHRERVLLSIRNALDRRASPDRVPGPQEEVREALRDHRRTRTRSRTSGRRSSRRPRRTPRSSSTARAERARSSSPGPSTPTACGPGRRSSRSTAPRSPRSSSNRSCSATRKGRSPAPPNGRWASSSRPTAARSFSTRSAT